MAPEPQAADWPEICRRYHTAEDGIAARKLAVNLVAIAVTWAALFAALRSFPLPEALGVVIPLGVVSALLFNQLFLYQHDMGHGAFFASRRLNQWVGSVVCVFMLTPFLEWTRSHSHHHVNVGRLERRVLGDIYTMTVEEWARAGWLKRLGYALFRSPVTLLLVAPLYYFFVSNRIKGSVCPDFPRGRHLASVHLTTAAYLLFALLMSQVVGLRDFAIVQAVTLVPAGALGIWIFYMGHTFEGMWFARGPEDWSHEAAALKGSSYCVMPRWLGWLLADIGYHHVHHLDPRIPCYRLRACHEENPALFAAVRPLSLSLAVRGLFEGRLYDAASERLVSFPKSSPTP